MATAEDHPRPIISDVIDTAKVFQGGGTEVLRLNLVAKVKRPRRILSTACSRSSKRRRRQPLEQRHQPRQERGRERPCQRWTTKTIQTNIRCARQCYPRLAQARRARKSATPLRLPLRLAARRD